MVNFEFQNMLGPRKYFSSSTAAQTFLTYIQEEPFLWSSDCMHARKLRNIYGKANLTFAKIAFIPTCWWRRQRHWHYNVWNWPWNVNCLKKVFFVHAQSSAKKPHTIHTQLSIGIHFVSNYASLNLPLGSGWRQTAAAVYCSRTLKCIPLGYRSKHSYCLSD